ncbi:MAG: SCO family protein [Actinomycetota bacterium]|nr:SCO family protein [Actinomycetota bacterium]
MTLDTAPPEVDQPRKRFRWPWIVATAVVLFVVGLIGGGLFRPYVFNGTVIQSSTQAPSMEGLVFSDGQPVDLGAFEDDVVLIYFGYTYCPDLCPTMMAAVDQATETLGDDSSRVITMMVTVDPTRDTLEGIGDYVRIFNEDFLGVWGTEDQVRSVATLYGATFEYGESADDGSYLVSHTASLMAVDTEGVLRVVYPVGVTSDELAADLRQLLR